MEYLVWDTCVLHPTVGAAADFSWQKTEAPGSPKTDQHHGELLQVTKTERGLLVNESEIKTLVL